LVEEKRREEEEEKQRLLAPDVLLEIMMNVFKRDVEERTDRVTGLRKQRASLLDERSNVSKNLRLATQQLSLAEAQQTAAAEAENYDLADQLAEVIERHVNQQAEYVSIRQNIDGAFDQLECQTNEVVKCVTDCFGNLGEKLECFRVEQTKNNDSTVALANFEATSKRLSGQSERLTADLKLIERDENLASEERKGLDATIHEQAGESEKLRDETSAKLMEVHNEIESLKKQLSIKLDEAKTLAGLVQTHSVAIDKVRSKFTRQLNRVEKKETTVKEGRVEWEAEHASVQIAKMTHDAEVQTHSEALLTHDETMRRIQSEKENTKRFQNILIKELDVRGQIATLNNNSPAVADKSTSGDEEDKMVDDASSSEIQSTTELAVLQSVLSEFEAAVDESQTELKLAEAALKSVKDEMEEINVRLPILLEEKKLAAKARNFKAAGKASKAIKELMSRKDQLEGESETEASERVARAKETTEVTNKKLCEQKTIVEKHEKLEGQRCMNLLANKIMMLEQIKEETNESPLNESMDDGNEENIIKKTKMSLLTVALIGAIVLDEEISALKNEGLTLDARFGGWEDIVNSIKNVSTEDLEKKVEEIPCYAEKETLDDNNESENVAVEGTAEDDTSTAEDKKEDIGKELSASPLKALSLDNDAGSVIAKEEAKKVWKNLTQRIEETAERLEKAADEEDYDLAAELDELLENLKTEVDALGLTSDEIDVVELES